jgi:hypothetical protein
MHRAQILLAALSLVLAGCATQTGSAPSDDGMPSAQPTRPVVSASDLPILPSPEETVTGEVPADIMATILADASDRTGLEPASIEVVQAIAVTWNDGSLGCPEPGMFYTQALVEGYHVILDADVEELDYRLDSAGGFRICEQPNRPGG